MASSVGIPDCECPVAGSNPLAHDFTVRRKGTGLQRRRPHGLQLVPRQVLGPLAEEPDRQSLHWVERDHAEIQILAGHAKTLDAGPCVAGRLNKQRVQPRRQPLNVEDAIRPGGDGVGSIEQEKAHVAGGEMHLGTWDGGSIGARDDASVTAQTLRQLDVHLRPNIRPYGHGHRFALSVATGGGNDPHLPRRHLGDFEGPILGPRGGVVLLRLPVNPPGHLEVRHWFAEVAGGYANRPRPRKDEFYRSQRRIGQEHRPSQRG